MLVVVNYHRIGVKNGLSIDEFRKNVVWLSNRFRLIDVNGIEKNDISMDNYAMITFDDGLKCQYNLIKDMLYPENIPFSIFMIGQPLFEKKIPNSHKLNIIFDKISFDEIKSNISYPKDISDDEVRRHYRYDNINVARLKYIVNYLWLNHQKDSFINKMFLRLLYNEEELCDSLFMNQKDLKEISNFGYVGSHAWTHNPLSKLDDLTMREEINDIKQHLESLLDLNIDSISYPLGNDTAINSNVLDCSLKVGYKYGFTMKRGVNYNMDKSIAINRIDCNDLPEIGKRPLFDSSFNQMPVVHALKIPDDI